MAITAEEGILAMLKNYYAKDGLVNLLYRNDPLLKKIKKQRVEGKQQNFSALYSRGGAVSASATKAEQLAKVTAQAKEFQVVPGQLFSACIFNNKELLASKTLRGAYENVAAAKFFASAESFRKTMAVALYGTGHGELFTVPAGTAALNSALVEVEFPRHAIMGIDIESEIEFKATAATPSTSTTPTAVVKEIKGTKVSLLPVINGAIANTVACISGCSDSDGNPLLPIGLAGWIPPTDVSTSDSFFGVNRSIVRDRLAGVYVAGTASQKKYEVIEECILELRGHGSLCDLIVMNDKDRLALAREVDSKTYFTKVDGGKGKSKAEVGYSDFGISISTNYLDNIIDTPYCPQGTAWILDSSTVELWTYTNVDKLNDGIADNEAGKPDVNGETDIQDKPYQLLVNDMFSIKSGETTRDGDAAMVKLNFYGNFVVTSPSVNGVVTFAA